MATYIDSSFLLSILLEQNESLKAIKIWKNDDVRVSSILLQAECIITLRRISDIQKKTLPDNWLEEKEVELKNLLQEVTIKIFDKSILDIIDLKKSLSGCRTLDAIHLASAMEFKDNFGGNFFICSYDINMRDISKKIGFKILPKKAVGF